MNDYWPVRTVLFERDDPFNDKEIKEIKKAFYESWVNPDGEIGYIRLICNRIILHTVCRENLNPPQKIMKTRHSAVRPFPRNKKAENRVLERNRGMLCQ